MRRLSIDWSNKLVSLNINSCKFGKLLFSIGELNKSPKCKVINEFKIIFVND